MTGAMSSACIAQWRYLGQRLVPYSITRIAPAFFTMYVVVVLARGSNNSALAAFSYCMALFSVATSVFSVPLAAVGNFLVRYASQHKRIRLVRSLAGVAAGLSLAAILVNVCLYFFLIDLSQLDIENDVSTRLSFYAYLFSTGLCCVNTFLGGYVEANGDGRTATTTRVIALAFGVLCIEVTTTSFPLRCLQIVLVCFLAVELVHLVLLVSSILRSVAGETRDRQPASVPEPTENHVREFCRISFPIGFGLGCQKLSYFFVCSRLFSEGSDALATYSSFSAVMNIFVIPFGAYAQAQSLYVSANPSAPNKLFTSLVGVAILLAIVLPIWNWGQAMQSEFGVPIGGHGLRMAGLFFLAASVFFGCGISYLRGQHDTLFPQLMCSGILLGVFVPLLYWIPLGCVDATTTVTVHAACLAVMAAVFYWRIMRGERSTNVMVTA
jgi:hypothetical protein